MGDVPITPPWWMWCWCVKGCGSVAYVVVLFESAVGMTNKTPRLFLQETLTHYSLHTHGKYTTT